VCNVFLGDGDSTLHHFSKFIEFCMDNNIIHEDDVMGYFAVSLKNNVEFWFKSMGRKQISSFPAFLEAFYKRWSFYDNEQWLPAIQ
jgi:hypothetical protein